jgi:uncharacterized surface protein with fasciclin (FAS1) repeats
LVDAGCSFYRDPPPVVIGGAPVAKDQPVMAALRASSDHRRFVAALEATGLDAELDGLGPLTVFAPNDAAFEGLRPKTAKALIETDVGALKQVLLGHIVQARLTTEDLLTAFPQLNGKTKVFAINKEVILAQGDAQAPRLIDQRKRTVNVVLADGIAANGILHVTDGVLLPKGEKLISP